MFRVLLPALLLASPALAQHQGHGTTTATAAAPKKVERKICKKDANTSSRYGAKKVCLTAAQWRQRDRDQTGYEDRRNDTRQRDD